MAATKKPKAKTKRRKVPAKRAAIRRKVAKPIAQRARKPGRKAPLRHVAPRPAKAKPAARPPVQTAPGERIGIVTHFYGNPMVAIVKLESGTLRVGDTIHIRGHTSDFSQRVESLQVEHAMVDEVGPNDDFGIKVVQHAREHDVLYKLPAS
jgi:putative protease